MPSRIDYEYPRIKTSVENQAILKSQGYTPVFSSNVSGIQRKLKDLYIRFHNGSIYVYPNQGSNFGDLLLSPSKGKWVWANLRRKNVSYSKTGSLPLEGDLDLTTDELMDRLRDEGLLVQAMEMVKAFTPVFKPITLVDGKLDFDKQLLTTSSYTKGIEGVPIEQLRGVPAEIVKEIKFVEAKTIEEAIIKANQYSDKVNYGETNIDQINLVNKTFDKLNTIAPLKEKLTHIGIEKTHGRNNAEYSSVASGGGGIKIKPQTLKKGYYKKISNDFKKDQENTKKDLKRYNSKIEFLKEDLEGLSQDETDRRLKNTIRLKVRAENRLKYKRWSTSADGQDNNESVTVTLSHEYGHAIEDQYIGRTFEERLREEYKRDIVSKEEYFVQYNRAKELEKTVNSNLIKARDNGDIYNISEYSTTNDKEFFAETFAMYTNNEKLPDYIKTSIEDILEFGKVVK